MTRVVDGGPWAGPDRAEWIGRFVMPETFTTVWLRRRHMLGPEEPVPDAPRGFHVQQIGLTSHLSRVGILGEAVCGTVVGSKPRGPALGLCLDCRAIAK
jgi:hypothetical protein